jgi:hypothetical protein
MELQFATTRCARTGGTIRRTTGRCVAGAFVAGFFAVSTSALGAGLETGYSTVIGAPSQSAPAGHRGMPARSIDLAGAKLDRSAERSRIVDHSMKN